MMAKIFLAHMGKCYKGEFDSNFFYGILYLQLNILNAFVCVSNDKSAAADKQHTSALG